MRHSWLVVMALWVPMVALAAQGGEKAAPKPATAAKTEGAKAELKDTKGKSVGTVTFEQAQGGLVLHVNVTALPAGDHALHVHEVGKCEAPFKSAGGHFNPEHHQHGIANEKGAHAGDLPNLHVGKDGTVQVDLFAPQLSLSGTNSILDADGSAVVVHQTGDDYHSDPAGNAGDRIACGVVTKS